jgi:hypothetical protein
MPVEEQIILKLKIFHHAKVQIHAHMPHFFGGVFRRVVSG